MSSTSGLAVTKTYEPHRDVVTRVQNQFGSNVVSQYDYVYDALRRRASMTRSGPAIDTLPQPTVPEQNITYTTNTVNQYTTVDTDGTEVSLGYDLDGSLINDGRFDYTYNAENRMIAATPLDTASGLQKVEAEYDYLGRRISKKVYTYTDGAWVLDKTNTFVYDGWNVIKEITTGSSSGTVYYVWGLDLSGTLQGAGGIGGLLLRKTNSGTFVYLYDANGNVEQLVNVADGSIAAHYKYDPFGVLLVIDGPEAQNNPYRYSTQYFDIETELAAYIFRYYSARLGRWTTHDPIEEEGGLNLYGFVGNNAINITDPLGLYTYFAIYYNKELHRRAIKCRDLHEFETLLQQLRRC